MNDSQAEFGGTPEQPENNQTETWDANTNRLIISNFQIISYCILLFFKVIEMSL